MVCRLDKQPNNDKTQDDADEIQDRNFVENANDSIQNRQNQNKNLVGMDISQFYQAPDTQYQRRNRRSQNTQANQQP